MATNVLCYFMCNSDSWDRIGVKYSREQSATIRICFQANSDLPPLLLSRRRWEIDARRNPPHELLKMAQAETTTPLFSQRVKSNSRLKKQHCALAIALIAAATTYYPPSTGAGHPRPPAMDSTSSYCAHSSPLAGRPPADNGP